MSSNPSDFHNVNTDSSSFYVNKSTQSPEQAKLPTTTFSATKSASSSLKSQAVRAVAAILTLGISEALRKTTGYILTDYRYFTETERKEEVQNFEKSYKNATKLKVNTSDGVKLDGMLVSPRGATPEKYVIWLNGFGQSYEEKLEESIEYANSANANILVFNFRGGKDSSTKANDFVTDTLSMVYLTTPIDKGGKGVDPQNIVIHGYSLGGGIGAAAAQREGIKHINDRSFSALSKAVKFFVLENLKSKIGETGAGILGSVTAALIKALDFELDVRKIAKEDSKSSNNSQITNLFDRTLIIHHTDDEMIKEKFSLHRFANKIGVKNSCVRLTKEDLLDLQKFKKITDENAKLLSSLPIATYQQYAEGGYTPKQYANMIIRDLPEKIELLKAEKLELEKERFTLKLENIFTPTEKEQIALQNQIKQLSLKIDALENLHDDLRALNLTPTAHGGYLSRFQAAAVYDFVNPNRHEDWLKDDHLDFENIFKKPL